MNTDIPADHGLEIDPASRLFRVARSNYVDPSTFEAEKAAIFSKCWLFVGHDTELAEPNAFLTRNIADRPIIFLRDRAGEVRCFMNICPHRGTQLCREREGKARTFTCLYHGWTFTNQGRAVSVAEPETYGPAFHGAGRNDLVPVPRFEQYRGFWFLNYDRNAESLIEYLAGARDYIDIIVDQAEAGMQVVGGMQEYSMRANWKLLAENSTDILHAPILHSTYLDLLGSFEPSGKLPPMPKLEGRSIDLGNGHAVVEYKTIGGRPIAQWTPAWGEDARAEIEAIRQRLVDRFGRGRGERMSQCNRNFLIFPNLVINDIMSLTVRTFQPIAPDYIEVTVWSLAPKEEFGTPKLERRLGNFLEFLGPGGFATPDDIEALEACQRAYAGWREAPWNDLSKGYGALPDTMDEGAQRAFWLAWRKRLGETVA